MPPSTARSICLALAPLALILSACSPSPTSTTSAAPARTQEQAMDTNASKPATGKIKVDQAELRKRLTPEQYEVTQNKGTERAFTGKYWNTHADGTYSCIVCGETLFDSSSKFDSGCGWPSFDKQLGGKIEYHKDTSYGMTRTEVTCAKCGAHLGHVFDDGPTATGQRYCINSASIDLKEKGEKK